METRFQVGDIVRVCKKYNSRHEGDWVVYEIVGRRINIKQGDRDTSTSSDDTLRLVRRG